MQKGNFDETFGGLRNSKSTSNEANVFQRLKILNFETSKVISDDLVDILNRINYASNANSVFYFYFPIVSHILYYKPEYESQLLQHLIGPNFANGHTDTKEMISLLQSAMQYKLSENPYFLTKESQHWIVNELPKLEKEIEREIQKCIEELNE